MSRVFYLTTGVNSLKIGESADVSLVEFVPHPISAMTSLVPNPTVITDQLIEQLCAAISQPMGGLPTFDHERGIVSVSSDDLRHFLKVNTGQKITYRGE